MVGGAEALTVRLACRAAAALALLQPVGAIAQHLETTGNCRDGLANGAFELRNANGQLRVAGAFAKGRRTGTFIFWNAAGARIAVVPYDDDSKTGTVALWYPPTGARGEIARKAETPYADGVMHGEARAWHPDGKPRGEYRYANGELVAAMAWTAGGAPLPAAKARAQAERDAGQNARTYAQLERLVGANEPRCD